LLNEIGFADLTMSTASKIFMTRLLSLLLLLPAGITGADDQHYVERLTQNGIEPNAASIRRYFESLHPQGDERGGSNL